MKKIIAIVGLALVTASFSTLSHGANPDVNLGQKKTQDVIEKRTKTNSEVAALTKTDAKASAKQKQKKAAEKAKEVGDTQPATPPHAHVVPEVNGSYATLAIALLTGMIAIRREAHRKRKRIPA
jgi:hypothetical protein